MGFAMKIILLIVLVILMPRSYAIPKIEGFKETGVYQETALIALMEAYYQTYSIAQAKDYMRKSCLNDLYKIEGINQGSIEDGAQQMKINIFHEGKYRHIVFRCDWKG